MMLRELNEEDQIYVMTKVVLYPRTWSVEMVDGDDGGGVIIPYDGTVEGFKRACMEDVITTLRGEGMETYCQTVAILDFLHDHFSEYVHGTDAVVICRHGLCLLKLLNATGDMKKSTLFIDLNDLRMRIMDVARERGRGFRLPRLSALPSLPGISFWTPLLFGIGLALWGRR